MHYTRVGCSRTAEVSIHLTNNVYAFPMLSHSTRLLYLSYAQTVGAELSLGNSMTSVGSRLAALNAVGAGELQAAAKTLLATTPSVAVVG